MEGVEAGAQSLGGSVRVWEVRHTGETPGPRTTRPAPRPRPPQAALLAQQDSVTPAVTTVVAVTVSLLGNLLAVGVLGMGIIGAAGSTVATQLVGVVVLAWFSATKPGRLRPALIVPTWGARLGWGGQWTGGPGRRHPPKLHPPACSSRHWPRR
jgi:hypothetical protein